MKATMPYIEVPGDNQEPYKLNEITIRERIMARSGQFRGMNNTHAVWIFGFLPESEAAAAYQICVPTFLWVLAKRGTADVVETFVGAAINLPKSFREVMDWEP